MNRLFTKVANFPVDIDCITVNETSNQIEVHINASGEWFRSHMGEPIVVEYKDFTEYGVWIKGIWWYIRTER